MTLKELHEKQLPMVLRAAVFGFTTVEAEMWFCGYSRDVAAGCLGARIRDGYLEPQRLDRDLVGFRITAAAVTTLGLRNDIRVAIGGVQAALPRLAALHNCAPRRVHPLIMTDGDIAQATSTDYRLVPGKSVPVVLLMIDAGGNPVRVRHKVNTTFAAAKVDPNLGPLVRRAEFAVRILTPSAGKADTLAKTFGAKKLPGPIEIDVVEEMQRWLL